MDTGVSTSPVMRFGLWVVLVLTVLLITAACDGSEGTTGLSGVEEAPAISDGGTSEGVANANDPRFQDALLQYTECMRKQGIEMPDPDTGGEGQVFIRGPGQGDEDEYLEADERCAHLLPDMGTDMSADEQADLQDVMLEFVECMRAEGVEMEDPEQGAIRIGGPNGADPDDPAFRDAQEKCREILERAPQFGSRS